MEQLKEEYQLPVYLFHEGKNYEAYRFFGVHKIKKGTYAFRVWAPHAVGVAVAGDFNDWSETANPMTLIAPEIWEAVVDGVSKYDCYKYAIQTTDGRLLMKADPYAVHQETRPGTASKVYDLPSYKWTDSDWFARQKEVSVLDKPVNIYEIHFGSWKQHEDGTFLTYREMADTLVPYVKDMGYTHVEIMGIAEYPFDGSWGYQVTNYYAPTSRYGLPEDFMYFIDYLHSKGIGIILDWVPAHFPKDAHGLGRFDGMPLYEHPDPRRGEHPDWGTYIFDYGRAEVANFLIANALFWVEKFHIDALRVDAVASMLYLDYGKQDGQWLPNENGGNENLDAIKLLQNINAVMEEKNPGAFLIAEESTAWAGVTAPASMNGLGFLFKWNMGWMNDFLEYMKMDPYFRSFNHNKLTFSLSYTYAENYVLVISHDEVVHLKCSMINKMPGSEPQKFANLRLAYGYMYGHPGKKLLFMGQEFAQPREWSEARSLDWFILDNPLNQGVQRWVKALNNLYNANDALYANDSDVMGFEWIDCDHPDKGVVSFIRRGSTPSKQLLFICNFVPVEYDNYEVGAPCFTTYKEVLNSDDVQFGGAGRLNSGKIKAIDKKTERMPYSISVTVPPLSTVVLEYDYTDVTPEDILKKKEAEKKAAAAKRAAEKKTAAKKTATEKKDVETTEVVKKESEKKTAATKTKETVSKTKPAQTKAAVSKKTTKK